MKKYFDYLDRLQESGETNMSGAVPYLQEEFPELIFDDIRAALLLCAWTKCRQNGGTGQC